MVLKLMIRLYEGVGSQDGMTYSCYFPVFLKNNQRRCIVDSLIETQGVDAPSEKAPLNP